MFFTDSFPIFYIHLICQLFYFRYANAISNFPVCLLFSEKISLQIAISNKFVDGSAVHV